MEIKGMQIPKIPRARFDWSKKHIGTYKKGPIYPVWSKIMPGNTSMELRASAVARQLSTLAPSFEETRIIMRGFTVPLRILWEDYKNWKVGFKEYSDEVPFNGDVPRWTPAKAWDTNPKSLWTALGFPCNTLPDIMPADFKAQAYAFIYDTNMRYRPVEDSVLIDGKPGTWDHKKGADENGFFQILRDRDYFTTGLTKQQIGEAVALPITGETSAYWDEILPTYQNTQNATEIIASPLESENLVGEWQKSKSLNGSATVYNDVVENSNIEKNTWGYTTTGSRNNPKNIKIIQKPAIFNDPGVLEAFNNNVVSMNNIASVTISMLRLAASRQKELELLARTGVFYPDVIRLNTGTAPSNEILGLPVYRGGFTIKMVNSEVLQTSQSTDNSSLGDMAGHSLGAGYGDAINVHVNEDSVFLLLMYIKSETFYGAQQFRKEDEFISNLDFPHPQYQHVSEQPVKKREICCASTRYLTIDDDGNRDWNTLDQTDEATEYNNETFMFQPNYESWTSEYNTVSGLMIAEQYLKIGNNPGIQLNYNLYNWTPARFFTNTPGHRPAFNLEFLQFKEDPRNQAVQYVDNKGQIIEDNYIIWIRLDTDVYLTLDKYRTPGGITL